MQVIHYRLEKLCIGLLPLGRSQAGTGGSAVLGPERVVKGRVSVITSHSPAGFPDNAAAFFPAVLKTIRPIANCSKPCCDSHISVLLQSSSLF